MPIVADPPFVLFWLLFFGATVCRCWRETDSNLNISPEQRDRTASSSSRRSATTVDQRELYDEDDDEECTSDKKVMDYLRKKYKNSQRPSESGVVVWVEVWVQEITSLNEILANFEAEIYITELWVDEALRYSELRPCRQNLSLNSDLLKELWTPNTCFINSKKALIHESPFKNVFLMIYPNGTVWVNYRLNVVGPCNIDLAKFPMDTQSCYLTLESFSYNIDEVKMRWINKTPVTIIKEILLPDFVLVSANASSNEVLYPAGYWDELTISFVFERRFGWYIFQAYVPTYLIIFISWISFCLGPKMIPARTMLSVNSLLALTFQFNSIMKSLPRVSYVKAMDVWMLACLTFIFCSLLELAVVGYLAKETPPKKSSPERRSSSYGSVLSRQSSTDAESTGVGVQCALRKSQSAMHYPNCAFVQRSVSYQPSRNQSLDSTSVRMSGAPKVKRKKLTRSADTGNSLLLPGSRQYLILESYYQDQQLEKRRGRRWCAKLVGCFPKFTWNTDFIDAFSLVAFPALFALFNIFYWSYYSPKD